MQTKVLLSSWEGSAGFEFPWVLFSAWTSILPHPFSSFTSSLGFSSPLGASSTFCKTCETTSPLAFSGASFSFAFTSGGASAASAASASEVEASESARESLLEELLEESCQPLLTLKHCYFAVLSGFHLPPQIFLDIFKSI